VLYAAGNVLFRTRDEGQTWEAISPDLTRNIKEKQQSSGGPITQDNTSVEYYGTVFAVAESPVEAGVIWTGSDDGLVHLTRDGGKTWTDVTPGALPREIQINSIEPHPTEPGGLYLAATAYKSDDFQPWLFRTTDYGKRWQRIDRGIDRLHFTRVVRADPTQEGLLYAGTERGVYVSADDGRSWTSLQLDLPVVPVTDLAVKEGALVVATQGRGYWMLDHLATVREALTAPTLNEPVHLFTPAPAWRVHNDPAEEPGANGTHAPTGVVFHYHLAQAPAEDEERFSLVIRDGQGQEVRRFTRKVEEGESDAETFGDDDRLLPAEAGLNRFVWNLRYPSAERFEGLVLWNRNLSGPRALPGDYEAILTVGETRRAVPVSVLADPRSEATPADLAAQFDFLWSTNRKLTETHRAIRDLRAVRTQIDAIEERVGDNDRFADLVARGESLKQALGEIEETLYQTRLESPQDPLNFPIQLNDKLAGVMGTAAVGDHPPTASAVAVRDELVARIDVALAALETLMTEDLEAFNAQAAEAGLPAAGPVGS
jgi:hypothetical protein